MRTGLRTDRNSSPSGITTRSSTPRPTASATTSTKPTGFRRSTTSSSCGHYKGIDHLHPRTPRHARNLDRRLRADGGRAGGLHHRRLGRAHHSGAIGDEASALTDSFQDNLLAPPVYTAPPNSAAGGSSTSCFRATSPRSPAGRRTVLPAHPAAPPRPAERIKPKTSDMILFKTNSDGSVTRIKETVQVGAGPPASIRTKSADTHESGDREIRMHD